MFVKMAQFGLSVVFEGESQFYRQVGGYFNFYSWWVTQDNPTGNGDSQLFLRDKSCSSGHKKVLYRRTRQSLRYFGACASYYDSKTLSKGIRGKANEGTTSPE